MSESDAGKRFLLVDVDTMRPMVSYEAHEFADRPSATQELEMQRYWKLATREDAAIRHDVARRMGATPRARYLTRSTDKADAQAMQDCEAMRAAGYTPRERLDAWEPR